VHHEEASDEGSDDANDDVHDGAEAGTLHDPAGDVAGDEADQDPDDEGVAGCIEGEVVVGVVHVRLLYFGGTGSQSGRRRGWLCGRR